MTAFRTGSGGTQSGVSIGVEYMSISLSRENVVIVMSKGIGVKRRDDAGDAENDAESLGKRTTMERVVEELEM